MKKLICAVLLASVLGGCANAKKDVTQAGQAFIDCAKTDIGVIVGPNGLSLLGTVASILSAGGTGWQAALDQLAMTAGADALACAVQAAETVWLSQATTGSGSATPTTSELPPALQRAIQEIEVKGWQYK